MTQLLATISRLTSILCPTSDEAASFASLIRNYGLSRIFLDEDNAPNNTDTHSNLFLRHKSLDAQFKQPGARYPGVVLEVSYSNDGKDLPNLAREWIIHSNGDTKVVIGIHIYPKGTKESTISVWRSNNILSNGEENAWMEIDHEVPPTHHLPLSFLPSEFKNKNNKLINLHNQPFRAPDTSVLNPAASLYLDLSDFALDELQKISAEYSQASALVTRVLPHF
ncbi:hypothetical protein BO94DRAFT_596378 [Aspergillus sclerotioniger CBS 115572]|uniref:Uncharacterized protein n=1 Tax=Aspergillus sclerotioniger CBS 115572 TaxID=1450535 RepID=A0A317WKY1_9EURO|nr:hypothetical protein BO94DRAFT_596378 [Aspergillus sclerotioniger CBS 115572]PWY87156.1 hypothetical protein BO94DRAFT_596378 [Aspergillus sclerotioniger CBS 115572]